MRSLVDSVIRPIAAFVLAAVVANCNEGCLPGYQSISPAEAYAMEISGCVSKRNAEVIQCAESARTVPEYTECKDEADENDRKCRSMVDRKYFNYNSNGNYPTSGQ